MQAKSIAALALAFVISMAAIAGEKEKQRIVVEIDDGDGPVIVDFDSDDTGFTMDELQLGESRTWVDENGSTTIVTRTEDGIEFDVDGDKVNVDDLAGKNEHEEKHVKKMMFADSDGDQDIMIITGKAVDAATQEKIRALLQDAGHGDDVTFIDSSAMNDASTGNKQVRVITKKVHVTN
ncbi:MAG: hypothetical protein WBN61_13255 [Woeseiaceae bacterium]